MLFRSKLNDVETEINGNTPLLVFDNHDNPRLDARYGDGVHDTDIERVISTMSVCQPRDFDVLLRRRDRHENHASHAQRGREGSCRLDRLAERQRPRRGADADAVERHAECGVHQGRRDAMAAGAAHLHNGQREDRGV